jgi:hypothetical protein
LRPTGNHGPRVRGESDRADVEQLDAANLADTLPALLNPGLIRGHKAKRSARNVPPLNPGENVPTYLGVRGNEREQQPPRVNAQGQRSGPDTSQEIVRIVVEQGADVVFLDNGPVEAGVTADLRGLGSLPCFQGQGERRYPLFRLHSDHPC